MLGAFQRAKAEAAGQMNTSGWQERWFLTSPRRRVELEWGMISNTSVARTVRAMLAVSLTVMLPGGLAVNGQQVRQPDEEVDSSALRVRPGLRPNANLLFNGWGMTPAGQHVPMSDLALKLVVAPDKQKLVAVHGGFNRHGVTLIDIASRKETQFLPLARSWNGLAFSADGKTVLCLGRRLGLGSCLQLC